VRRVVEQYGNAAGSVGTLVFSNTGDATYRQTVVSLPFVGTESARERERERWGGRFVKNR